MTQSPVNLPYTQNPSKNGDDIQTFEVLNPATGESVGHVKDSTVQDAMLAVDKIAKGFETFKHMPARQRGDLLIRVYRRLLNQADDIAKIMTLENGKPLAEAKGEFLFGLEYLRYYGEEARRIAGSTLASPFPGKSYKTLKMPVGPVYAITPWNFPAAMVTRKIAPAIAAGCTVLLKPAPETPLTALCIVKAFEDEGAPEGMLEVVTTLAAKEVSEAVMARPEIKKVAFTGSTPVGKLLMEQASASLKRVSFELGGNAPFIIFDDCNLEKAVDDCLAIKFMRVGGQSCICANRIYVQEGIAETFTNAFAKKVSELKMGNGLDDGMQLGPMIHTRALERIDSLVQDALEGGAKILTGGKASGPYYEPTVLVNAQDNMRVCKEEIFGPVAPILIFKTQEEVIKRANDTTFGLAGYVQTQDMKCATEVSAALECGLVGVNDASGYIHESPFGGVKESGIGREGGQSGLAAYLEEKTVVVAT